MILACLIQAASSLSNDASALEGAISALESDINALDSSSLPLEHSLPWFTGVVALGVLMELWVIWHERREGMDAWERGIVRPPDRPSRMMYLFEIASVVLITGGIVGELWVGVKTTSINGVLRSKNAELRTDSDQLVELLHGEAEGLRKDAEDERTARVEAEETIAWRRLTPGNQRKLKSELGAFNVNRTWFQYNTNDVEAFNFAHDLAASLPPSWNPTEPEPTMSMREGLVPLGKYGPLERGILVTAVGDKSYETDADLLVALLSSLGFDCKKAANPLANARQYAPMIIVSVEPRPEGRQGELKLKAEARSQQLKTRIQWRSPASRPR